MSEVSDISTRRLQNVKQSKLLQCPYELLRLIIAYFRTIVELKHFTHTCSMLFHIVDAKDWSTLYYLQHPTRIPPLRFDHHEPHDTDYWKCTSLNRRGYNRSLNVVVTGHIGVGRSNLVSRFVRNKVCPKRRAALEVDFGISNVWIRSEIINVSIWASNYPHRSNTPSRYRRVHGVVMVYDITRRFTYEDLHHRLREIDFHVKSNIPIMLVGNKSDLSHLRTVSTDEGMHFAAENGLSFIEVSALDLSNVQLLFQRFLTEVYMANTFPYKC
ncbi:unnamed protein product [Mortierella alpina]